MIVLSVSIYTVDCFLYSAILCSQADSVLYNKDSFFALYLRSTRDSQFFALY